MTPGYGKPRSELPWLPYESEDKVIINAHNFSAGFNLTNLISHYKFNEASGNATDSHGSNTLTAVNSPGTTTGKIGNARTFAAASSRYFSRARITSGSIAALTVVGWIKTSASESFPTICGEFNASGNHRSWVVTLSSDSTDLRCAMNVDGVTASNIIKETTGLTINDGSWHFFAWTYNAGSGNLRVDAGSTAYTGGPATLFNSTANFAVSAVNVSSTPAAFITGDIDSLSIFQRVLSVAELDALYNSGSGIDYPF